MFFLHLSTYLMHFTEMDASKMAHGKTKKNKSFKAWMDPKPENRIDPHMDTAEPEAETGQYQLITGYW